MDELENQLRNALKRKPAPDGFANRVQARTTRKTTWHWRWAAAAMLLVTVGGASYYEIEQRRGEAAKEKTLLALRITSEKLNYARTKLLKAHSE